MQRFYFKFSGLMEAKIFNDLLFGVLDEGAKVGIPVNRTCRITVPDDCTENKAMESLKGQLEEKGIVDISIQPIEPIEDEHWGGL